MTKSGAEKKRIRRGASQNGGKDPSDGPSKVWATLTVRRVFPPLFPQISASRRLVPFPHPSLRSHAAILTYRGLRDFGGSSGNE